MSKICSYLPRRPLAVLAALLFIILAVIRLASGIQITEYDGTVTVTGYVQNKEIKNSKSVVYLKDASILGDNSQNIKLKYNVVCYVNEEQLPDMGSLICVQGNIGVFDRATNPGQFDYKKYYLSLGYGYVLYKGNITAKSREYSEIKEKLYRIRQYFSGIYDAICAEGDSQILNAMVLGEKGELSEDIKEIYQKNGISHVLAISGLHIGIIGMLILKILKSAGFPGWLSFGVSSVTVFLYAMMTGFSIGTVRAMLMFIIGAGAAVFLRTYDIVTALCISALIEIIWHPYIFYNGGFWLSFLAVAGIAVFGRAMSVGDECENKGVRKIINIFISGFSVSFFTMPVVLYYYFEYPVYSVPLNLLVIPAMTVLLVAAILAGLIGAVNLQLGAVVEYPCHLILVLYEKMCVFFDCLPGKRLVLGRPQLWRIVLFYIICIGVIYIYDKREKIDKIRVIYITRLAAVILGLILVLPYHKGFKLAVLDVGQGDGIVMLKDNICIAIDGGSTSKSGMAEYILKPYVKSQGLSRIDYWFVSHPDADHISGLSELLADADRDIQIGTVLLPDTSSINEDAAELIELLRSAGVQYEFLSRGEQLLCKDLSITVISPEGGMVYGDINDYSEVLLADYKGYTMLFTGDATTLSEDIFCRYLTDTRVDMLKVGHHGSSTSTGDGLISTICPETAVISVGKENRYGHPHQEVLDRLVKNNIDIFRTDISGAFIVSKK